MLKFSIFSGVWILTVLLLADSVTTTKKHIIETTDYCQHDCSDKNSNYFPLRFTHSLQYFINHPLNDTCVQPSLSTTKLIALNNDANNSKVTTEHSKELEQFSSNNIDQIDTKLILITNGTSTRFVTKRNRANYLWKRRTLCAISDEKKHSSDVSLQRANGDAIDEILSEKKTLLDYDAPTLVNDIDTQDSLKSLVRVKRSPVDTFSSSVVQQDYLKDLANSFPRNAYESLEDNSYDEDVSWDAKREINSQEYFTNEEQVGDLIQNDQLNEHSFKRDVSMGNNFIKKEQSSREITDTPLDDGNTNLFQDRSSMFEDRLTGSKILSSQIPSNNIVSVVNRRRDDDQEILNPSEDPMLAVELVRKKRDHQGKQRNKKKVDQSTDASLNNDNNDRKRSIENPSLAIANFKAKLLRSRRKAKSDRHGGSPKTKKKKKQAGKKHKTRNIDDTQSKQSVCSKNNDRKNSEMKIDGNSNVGIANLVSKRNNGNFHRRSVKPKQSVERIDSVNNNLLRRAAKSSEINEENIATFDNDEPLVASSVVRGNGNIEKIGMDESSARERVESSIPVVDTKLRTKRDEHTRGKHGFLNQEDELRYYENIREPESDTARCVDRNESPPLGDDIVEGNRAVRSIEEVKELAQKLVTKVNELQSYLNIDESNNGKGREKRTDGTRGIDDLCLNVSTASEVFRETPKIVRKCVPPENHEFASAANIVERKADTDRNDERRKYVKREKEHSGERKRGAVKVSSTTSRTVREESAPSNRKWGRWTDWSSCSVTCGKGRQIRWRYCLRDCSTAETEMEEKACQLPACPPGKFLGIF